jgi:hypothetical protein
MSRGSAEQTELSPDEMRVRFPALTAKHEMIALEDGIYSKHGGVWYLLDPPTKESK